MNSSYRILLIEISLAGIDHTFISSLECQYHTGSTRVKLDTKVIMMNKSVPAPKELACS